MNSKRFAVEEVYNTQPFIGGRLCKSNARERFQKVDPATEELLCTIPVGSQEDVESAVREARGRFEDGSWSRLSAARRVEILLKLSDLVGQHAKQLSALDTLEMGKPLKLSIEDADQFAPMLLRSWAGFADKLWGASAPFTSGPMALNVYEPRGVIGAITAWNFPLVNAVVKCAPALAAGNSVVLKPSEMAAGSALMFARLAVEAGVPEGVLNVVPGLGSTVGIALAEHSDVDLLSFTGSTITGRKVMELAARSNGKPVILECGGKSPQIVFDDVDDMDLIAEMTTRGAFWNQGQVCSAHTRLIVHERIKDRLMERILELARAYQIGDPWDEETSYGPLASPGHRDRVKAYVEQGIEMGAEAVLRGEIWETGGCYVLPTIFDRVDHTMPILREEIFGPVLCVQSFRTEAEAIRMANSTEYGLEATVWTRDMGRGRRLARELKAGTVFVRTSGEEEPESGSVLSSEPQRRSGFGAELGLGGLQAYSTLKLVSFSGA